MMRNWKGLLLTSMLVAMWASSAEACHRRRACPPAPCGDAGYGYASPTGYYGGGGGYYGGGGGYYGGGTPGYPGGYSGYGYGYGRPYNPGGLGGPMSGLGVRPGLGFGGFGPGR
jgi:hypothetical protein